MSTKHKKKPVLLEINNLKMYFPIEKGLMKRVTGYVKALDGISFQIMEGETLGLVGESGCGKTTLGRCILRAMEPTGGTVNFNIGTKTVDVLKLTSKSLRKVRKDMQMIFQDPYSSLDPRMTVLDIIKEPLEIGKLAHGEDLKNRVKKLMNLVGLELKHLNRFPNAFSGGQRQRIGIARAIATNPNLIICDEAVSALDVSVQAQILNLLQELQSEIGMAYLFISHDLYVVEYISDRIAVMYVGGLVELAKSEDLFRNPKHPYTEALLSAVPNPDPDAKRSRIHLKGEVANTANVPTGCSFHPRCKYAQQKCFSEKPKWKEIRQEHYVACHFSSGLDLKGVYKTS